MDVADDRDIPDYTSLIRRFWRPAIVFTILGVVLSGLAVHEVAPKYTAHAAVLVQPIELASASGPVTGGRTSGAVDLDTEAQLVKSTPVASRAKASLDSSDSVAALVSRVLVTVPANSSVLVISYTAHTPALAAAGAHDFATAYLANRTSSAQQDVRLQSTAYTKQLTTLDQQLLSVTNRLASESPSSATRAYDSARKNSLTGQINNLSETLNQLTTTAIIPGRIITDATPPAKPSGPNRTIYIASGVLMGLLIGLLFGLVRMILDKRIKAPRDVGALGIEVLASLPAKTSPNALGSPGAAAARSVQQLGALLGNALRPHQSVVIIGVDTDSTLVVTNLAYVLTQAELRVAVVCVGSAARPTAQLLGAGGDIGVSDVLGGRSTLASAVQMSTIQPRLFVLAPGANHGVEAAGGPSFKRILNELRDMVDVVLVQTPPANESSNATAQVLAGVADSALLVAGLNRTRRPGLADTAALLNRMGTTVIGAVTVEKNGVYRRGVVPPAPTRASAAVTTEPSAGGAPGSSEGTSHGVVGGWTLHPERAESAREENGSRAEEIGWPGLQTPMEGRESSARSPRP